MHLQQHTSTISATGMGLLVPCLSPSLLPKTAVPDTSSSSPSRDTARSKKPGLPTRFLSAVFPRRLGLRYKLAFLMTITSASALLVAFLILGSLAAQQYAEVFQKIRGVDAETRASLLETAETVWKQQTAVMFLVVPFIGFLISWLMSLKLESLISRPITQLAQTALRVTEVKDYSPRLKSHSNDEVGDLITGFNEMLAEIERREFAVEQAQRLLEQKVLERTRDLRQEVVERRQAQKDLAQQLARIHLLNQITQAIATHQDLQSILSVVLGELTERLPADFGCVLLAHEASRELRVAACREREIETAFLVWKVEKWVLPTENCGWQKPDDPAVFVAGGEEALSLAVFLKPRELGMKSAAGLPLRHEGRLQGVLLVARRAPDGFSEGEQGFLRALSEHVALAGHQAHLYMELQRAYDELRQTQKAVMQHERLRALGQMASGVAHDINNALSPVGGFAELLLTNEKNLSDNARKYLAFIKTASDDIAHIVSRLREFYRSRAEQQPLLPVDANKLIREVVDLTRPRWRDVAQRSGAHIEARLDLCADTPTVHGIESELREALTNLIFNAVDAMPQGGTLTLRSRVVRPIGLAHPEATPTYVLLEVADTGTGMSEEARQHCLEPFFSTKGQRGTGLGLAMVYGTAERHDGTIEIDSAPGKGTTMRLALPLRQSKTTTAATETESPRPRKRLRVLFVDDEPLLRELIREILESDGHEVITADGGAEALEVFDRCRDEGNTPDVVITDLGMPNMDGAELTLRLKETAPTIPVIMMTGWGKMMRGEEEVSAPVDALISKPPRIPELQAALQKVTQPQITP